MIPPFSLEETVLGEKEFFYIIDVQKVLTIVAVWVSWKIVFSEKNKSILLHPTPDQTTPLFSLKDALGRQWNRLPATPDHLIQHL